MAKDEKVSAEQVVRDIRRETRHKYSAEEKIRSVLEALLSAELRTHHVFPGRLDVRSQEPAMAESVMLERATPQEAVDTFLEHAAQVFDLYRPDLDEYLAADALVW